MSCTGTEPHSHAPEFCQGNRAGYDKGKGTYRYCSPLENQKPMELLQIKLIKLIIGIDVNYQGHQQGGNKLESRCLHVLCFFLFSALTL